LYHSKRVRSKANEADRAIYLLFVMTEASAPSKLLRSRSPVGEWVKKLVLSALSTRKSSSYGFAHCCEFGIDWSNLQQCKLMLAKCAGWPCYTAGYSYWQIFRVTEQLATSDFVSGMEIKSSLLLRGLQSMDERQSPGPGDPRAGHEAHRKHVTKYNTPPHPPRPPRTSMQGTLTESHTSQKQNRHISSPVAHGRGRT
jgi:hypothetical protein